MITSPQFLVQENQEIPDRVCSYLEIDLKKIAQNYMTLKGKLKESQCGAVLKANSYGFGIEKVSKILAQKGCRHFFVSHLEEGMALRQHLKNESIYVFSGVIGSCAAEFVHYNLTPVINDFEMLKDWVLYANTIEQKLPLILNIDTGMRRSGLDYEGVQKLIKHIDLLDSVNVQFLMSHLSSSNILQAPANIEQRSLFKKICSGLPHYPVSLADTGGIYLGSQFHYQLVRPGKGLFGMFQTPENEQPLYPCMKLKGRIIQLRKALKGETVGYKATHSLERDSRLATIAIGFADGYDRGLSNKAFVEIAGHKAPVVGLISMDYIVVDVTDIPAPLVQVGEWAEIINERLTLGLLAKLVGTNPLELSTRFSSRVHRYYKGE